MKQLLYKAKDYKVSTIYATDVEQYETMIIYPSETSVTGNSYVLALRYATEEEARKGHLQVIQNLKRGMTYSGNDEIFNEFVKNQDILGFIKNISKISRPNETEIFPKDD